MRARVCMHHEHVNERFKKFQSMNMKFHHGITMHGLAMQTVTVITQLLMESMMIGWLTMMQSLVWYLDWGKILQIERAVWFNYICDIFCEEDAFQQRQRKNFLNIIVGKIVGKDLMRQLPHRLAISRATQAPCRSNKFESLMSADPLTKKECRKCRVSIGSPLLVLLANGFLGWKTVPATNRAASVQLVHELTYSTTCLTCGDCN